MSQRNVKEFRRQANQVSRQTIAAVAPALAGALSNTEILRGRVEVLEAVSARPFLGRLKWLLLGR